MDVYTQIPRLNGINQENYICYEVFLVDFKNMKSQQTKMW